MRRSLGVDARRVRTIYNPIPADSIRRLAQAAVTHPWFADGELPVILSVGREGPSKDYPTLVEAFGLARREVESRLVILGRLSAPYRARLKSLALGLGVSARSRLRDFDGEPLPLHAAGGNCSRSPRARRACRRCSSRRWRAARRWSATDAPFGPREILGCWGDLPPVGDAAALARALVATLRGERPTEDRTSGARRRLLTSTRPPTPTSRCSKSWRSARATD